MQHGSADNHDVYKVKNMKCWRCNRGLHNANDCKFKNLKCFSCGRIGHIKSACRSSNRKGRQENVNVIAEKCVDAEVPPTCYSGEGEPSFTPGMADLDAGILHVGCINRVSPPPIKLYPFINEVRICMELDTGAAVSILSKDQLKRLPGIKIRPCETTLTTYTGGSVTVIGEADVLVQYGNYCGTLPIIITDSNNVSLLGRDWLTVIPLDWTNISKSIKSISSFSNFELNHILSENEEIFRDELGSFNGVKAKIKLKENACPKFFKPRAVPYALKDKITQKIKSMVDCGVLESVNFSDWASPLVIVPKPNNDIRLCADFKVTINRYIEVDSYPLPKPSDIFANLNGGTIFSKLDLSRAYEQIEVDESCRHLLTINTHMGLFRFKRLPYRVASAVAVFQMEMEKLLSGIPGVIVYLDDILISGRSRAEHFERLKMVLKRLREKGIRLKREKCSFLQDNVKYLGYVVSRDGLKTCSEKVTKVLNMKQPGNVTELKSFMGLVNYYGRFLKNLSTVINPLNKLLRANEKWVWTKECEDSFKKLKVLLAEAPVLAHYDVNFPLKLECDASSVGIGAVISHVFPNGDERPIAYAARSLNQSKHNYS